MKLRGFLLGAASLVAASAAGGAEAADYLDAAEPIDYVKVCDAFGTGYWYIPGTDTCLRISGYVRWDALFDELSDYHYDFKLRARLNFDAKSQTDWGTLQGYIRAQADEPAKGAADQSFIFKPERAYITLGGWFAGLDSSFYDYSNGDGGFTLERRGFRSDTVIDHVGYRYTPKTGIGWFASLEENRSTFIDMVPPPYAYSYPDVIAGLTYTGSVVDVKLSAAGVDEFAGYAVQGAGTIKLDSIAKGDALRFIAAYANNAQQTFTGVGGSRGFVTSSFVGESWSVLGSFRHYWKPEFVTAITATYGAANGAALANGIEHGYEGIVSANYSPAKGIWIGPELSYLYDDNGTAGDVHRWLTMLRVLREF